MTLSSIGGNLHFFFCCDLSRCGVLSRLLSDALGGRRRRCDFLTSKNQEKSFKNSKKKKTKENILMVYLSC